MPLNTKQSLFSRDQHGVDIGVTNPSTTFYALNPPNSRQRVKKANC